MINKELISRFAANPAGFVKRVLYKYTLGPLKYGKGDDYNASEYWDDRFSKYDNDILGPGDEALDESKNNSMYDLCRERFLKLCGDHQIEFPETSVLEVGIGNGFYTEIMKNSGLKSYRGADISDVLFSRLQKKFPGFKFDKVDATSESLDGTYDLVLLIDVIQHIVNDNKLEFAFENIKKTLKPGGYFMLTPILNMDKRHFFYLKSWSLQKIMKSFQGYIFSDIIPFKDSYMILLQKPAS